MGNAAEFGLVVGTGGNAFVSLSLNTAASSLHLRSSVPVTKPTWIALDHKTNDVFAVSELADGPYGQVTLFGATGNGLSTTWQSPGRWNAQTSSSGTAYASIAYRDGKPFYLAANYAGGTADVFDATGQRTDYRAYSGSGPFPGRQEASHAHQIIEDLSHEYVYVTDLGGDAVHQYSLDAHGKLTDITTLSFNPGEGPRHVDFNPQKKDILYVVCELSNDIVVFTRSGRAWQRKQTVTLIDAKYKGRKDPRFKQPASAAAIAVTQDASMLYATVRYIPESHDADIIVSMALQRDGLIDESHVRTFDTQTVGPRDIALSMDSEQRYLAAAFKESNLVRIYDRLKEFEVVCELEVEKPSCIHFQ